MQQETLIKFKELKPFSYGDTSMVEEVLKLRGRAAEAFLKYDSRKLSKKERAENKKAHEYYIRHKSGREGS